MSELEKRINAWLAGVSGRTGVALALDDEGTCGMACGDGLEVGVVALEPERVGLFAAVGQARDNNRASLSEALLNKNLFAVHPHGAALGLDDETGTAYLCLPLVAATLESESFQDILGEFILAAGETRKQLALLDDQGPGTDNGDSQMSWSFNRA